MSNVLPIGDKATPTTANPALGAEVFDVARTTQFAFVPALPQIREIH
jgi:hypothetical protein